LDGEPSRLVDRDDLAPDRVLRVGAVHDPLPRIPAPLAEYDCRNNALALAALAQIESPIARALREYGAERIGVVMGTSPSGVTNPCSRNRAGLTLGEGAAVFLVESGAGGVQLLGIGESSEAHHMSAPDPSGGGAEAAMRGALADAGLAPDAIAYLNLHGTGTP